MSNMKKIILVGAVLLTTYLIILGFSKTKIGEIYINKISANAIQTKKMYAGVVDVNRLLASIPQVKAIQDDIKNKFDARSKEVIDLQKSFLDNIKTYRQTSDSMEKEVLKKEQQKLVDENKKLEEMQVNFQRDLVAAQNEALRPVLKQIDDIVHRIAKEHNFDMIIAKTSTLYYNSQFEITDQVIAEMAKLAPTAAVTTDNTAAVPAATATASDISPSDVTTPAAALNNSTNIDANTNNNTSVNPEQNIKNPSPEPNK